MIGFIFQEMVKIAFYRKMNAEVGHCLICGSRSGQGGKMDGMAVGMGIGGQSALQVKIEGSLPPSNFAEFLLFVFVQVVKIG